MSNPNDFLNFEPSTDPLSELPSQGLLEYLNNASTQDGGLINVSGSGTGNAPSLSPASNQMGLLPVHRPIPSPSGLNASDDFLELLKTNASQLGELQSQGAEGVEDNGVASDASILTRSISEVTMDMLHRTPFANVAKHETDGSMSVPNGFVGYGQPAQAPSTINAIQMVRQENLMPTPPLQQTANASQYGTANATAALTKGLLMQEGKFFSLPFKPGHGGAGPEAQPAEVKLMKAAEPRTPQAIVQPPDDVHGVAHAHPLPSGLPSGTLQAAKQNNGDKLLPGVPAKRSRGGAVVRRVLKRMGKSNSDVPSLLSSVCDEQTKSSSTEVKHQFDAEEKRGKKRKIENAENEEELKKLRRVRNRESVEKCRAKQRIRLEKLEEEDRALRSECEIMRQMAEVFQEKWKQVAEEYHKICGKEAGECPMVIPPNTTLPEAATLSAAERS